MCGRSASSLSSGDLMSRTKTQKFNHQQFYRPCYNLGPDKASAVMVSRPEPGQSTTKCLEAMRWGLRAKQESDKALRINARAETVGRFYKANCATRRCVVVCDGFFEWVVESNGAGVEKRRPYFVERPGELLLFAGIYEDDEARGFERNGLARYSVVTVPVSAELEWLHDR